MKEIPHIKDYYVCENGYVYGVSKNRLKTQTSRDGYELVSIWERGKCKSRTYSVHRLVAITFIKNPDNLPCVNHIDGDKQNNNINNLEWCSYSRNSKHSYELGLQKPRKGFENSRSYSKEMVHEICKLLQDGLRNIDIAKRLNIPTGYVKNVRGGKVGTEISCQYKFRKRSNRLISEDTVHWVCRKIMDGLSNIEISELSDNSRVNRWSVNQIRTKKSYKDISDLYF